MRQKSNKQQATKEEVVSIMTNLEVISEESFQRRLQGMASCQDCIKERARGQGKRKGRRAHRPTRSKHNSPIVIRLQDTIKVSVKGRRKGKVSDAESSDSGSEEHPDGTVNQLSTCPVLEQLCSERAPENISALLSAIEKVHSKEKVDFRANYDNLQEYVYTAKDPSRLTLNNTRYGHRSQGCSQLKQHGLELISDANNVQLICNDLSSKKFNYADSFDDSENASTISNSESQVDSEISSSDSLPEELSQEEVEHLAQYTTGYPILRYNCPQHECPECCAGWASYWNNVGYYMQTKAELSNWCPGSSCGVDTKPVEVLQTEENDLKPVKCKVVSVAPGKVEVFIGDLKENQPKKSGWANLASDANAIFADLGDNDVSLDVYYHADAGHVHANTSDWLYGNTSNFVYHPVMYPSFMMPTYVMPMPLYTSPKPIIVPRDTRCLASSRLCMVPAHEVKSFTASQPPQRPWIPLAHPERSRPIAMYTVMCYNVLCDKYATRQLYGYCPSWALSWEYRKKGIIEEIRHYSADIISLQEVETDQFYNFFLPELKRDGYDGIFSPKSRARTMTEQERKHVDGCAIFYRTTKFSLVKEHLVEFNQLAMANAEGSDDMLNRVMTKDNIGLAALLETKEAIWQNGMPPEGQQRQPLLVATCHVHWDPEYCDVKLIQTIMLMNELKNILEQATTSLRPGSSAPDCSSVPLILCGDLNSLPESGVVEYLSSGKVAVKHEDFKDIGYESCLEKLSLSENRDIYTHGFKLASAYAKDVMPYTNYTFDFKGVIDYVFFSRDCMTPLGVLGPMDQNWFSENKVMGCPHPHVPSDHFPLLVELEMQVPAQGPSTRGPNNLHLIRR